MVAFVLVAAAVELMMKERRRKRKRKEKRRIRKRRIRKRRIRNKRNRTTKETGPRNFKRHHHPHDYWREQLK